MSKESKFGIASSGLVFRESFSDESAVRKNGGTPTDVNFSNGVGSFNGTSSGIEYSIPQGMKSYTFRMKFKTNILQNCVGLLTTQPDTRANGFTISINSDGNLCVDHAGFAETIVLNPKIEANKEYEFVYVFEFGYGITVYLDGEYAGQDTSGIANKVFLPNQNFWISGSGLPYSGYLDGEIKLVEMYNRAVSEEEAKNLYESKAYKQVKKSSEFLSVDAYKEDVTNKYTSDIFGDEIVVNGTFDDSSSWTTGTGWSITGGQAVGTSVANGQYLSQSNTLIKSGKTYLFQCDVTITSGTLKVQLGTSGDEHLLSSGSNTIEITPSANNNIYFLPYSTFTGTIDNISIKEIAGAVTKTNVDIVNNGELHVMSFSGSSSQLSMPSYDNLDGNVTFVAWIKPRYFDEYNFIFSNQYFHVQVTPLYAIRVRSDGNTNTGVSSNNTIKSGLWQQVAVTRASDGKVSFFFNGEKDKSDLASGTPTSSTNDYYIGAEQGGSSVTFFRGRIGSVKLFSSILSDEEIAQLYTSERRYYG